MLALIILAIVFLLIMIRQVGNVRMQIWQVMLGGAAAMLLTLQISPVDALRAINLDVIIFLFCMFLIGQALEESGYLAQLSFHLFKRARSTGAVLFTLLFGMGMLSAILLNDTLAIVGTPVVLLLGRKHRISPKLLLLALAFAVTIGSIMSPIGNPQNLLIAFKLHNPFIIFLRHLLIPTVLSLLATYILLKLMFKGEFHSEELVHTPAAIKDERLALFAKMSLILLVALIAAKVTLVFFGLDFRMTYIAIIAALPVLFSRRNVELVRHVDWYTLIFFAAMFVVMEAVWLSGEVQELLGAITFTIPSVLLVGVLGSQLISNVPLVALLLPHIAGVGELIALAAGSTLAGNLFILGAASNVIIIAQAEQRGETITFWEFAKAGIPVTIVTLGIFWLFLS